MDPKALFRRAVDDNLPYVVLGPPRLGERLLELDSLDILYECRPGRPGPLASRFPEAAWAVSGGGFAVRTELLRRLPLDRLSGGETFLWELALQAASARASVACVAGEGRPPRFSPKRWALGGLYRAQALGILYDRRFDVGERRYEEKPWGSHSALCELVPPGSKVLDLGCGEGWLARRLEARGCEVEGVDVLAAVPTLRRYHRLDLERERDRLRKLLADSRPGTVVLADVLEHLSDPEGLVDTLRGRRVVASTGNVAFFVIRVMLGLGYFNYGPRGILDRTHRRLFTLATFKRLFRQGGFRVVKVRGLPVPFRTLLPRRPRLARFLEGVNGALARALPGLFAYQLVVVAE